MKAILISIVCLALIACEGRPERERVYAAWMKATNDPKQLTFAEWDLLYQREMLPGQEAAATKRAANNAAAMSAAAMGMSAGKK